MAKTPKFIKILVITLIVVLFALWALYSYVHTSFSAWCEEKNISVSIQSSRLHWTPKRSLSVFVKGVEIKNKQTAGSFSSITAQSMDIHPLILSFIRSYGKDFQLSLKMRDLKVAFASGDVFVGDHVTCDVDYRKDKISVNHIMIEPLRINLSPEKTTLTPKGERNENGAHLIVYKIKGDTTYCVPQKDLTLSFQIPPASVEMSPQKVYSVTAHGKLHFVDKGASSSAKDDPGVRGQVTLTFQNFSNFLRHLQQSRVISTIAIHLSEIVGHSLGYHDILNQEKEFFPNAISFDLFFKNTGIYFGSYKIS